MHIPGEMITGAVCPVTAALAVTGVAIAAYAAAKASNKPSQLFFGAIAALIFAAQMINFPVQDGTSGHLLGGMLAVALLGVPFGVLALALVVSLQALVFADGGLTVLGANVLNMSVLGAGICGLVWRYAAARVNRRLALAATAWASVVLAALACSVELGESGAISFSKVAPAMFAVHALIGVGEALITVVLVELLSRLHIASSRWQVGAPLLGAVLMAGVLSPFASTSPDGLEWVAQQYGFFKESAPMFVTPLADYSVAAMANPSLSTSLAGLLGVLLVVAMACVFAQLLILINRKAF